MGWEAPGASQLFRRVGEHGRSPRAIGASRTRDKQTLSRVAPARPPSPRRMRAIGGRARQVLAGDEAVPDGGGTGGGLLCCSAGRFLLVALLVEAVGRWEQLVIPLGQ